MSYFIKETNFCLKLAEIYSWLRQISPLFSDNEMKTLLQTSDEDFVFVVLDSGGIFSFSLQTHILLPLMHQDQEDLWI